MQRYIKIFSGIYFCNGPVPFHNGIVRSLFKDRNVHLCSGDLWESRLQIPNSEPRNFTKQILEIFWCNEITSVTWKYAQEIKISMVNRYERKHINLDDGQTQIQYVLIRAEQWLYMQNIRCFPLEPFFEINPGILCSGIGS